MSAAKLRRVLNPQKTPTWLWGVAGDWRNISGAGLADDLAEAANFLLDENIHSTLCAAATQLGDEANSWTILQAGHPRQALALGKNFAAHAREFGVEPPSELVWFNKLASTLSGHRCVVEVPAWLESRVDHEAEVVLLIGKDLHNANLQQAAAAIAAYTLGNDITARTQQGLDRQRQWPWLRCKNLVGFGPFGPEWTRAGDIGDFANIELRGWVNQELRQNAKLADLIWQPAEALVELSKWCRLAAGDIVFLGTPAGVGAIKDGDLLRVEATELGCLTNQVVRHQ